MREKGDWGLGTRERLPQRNPFFYFCGRQRPQNSDWLIFDGKSHGNDVIDEDVQLEDLNLVAAASRPGQVAKSKPERETVV